MVQQILERFWVKDVLDKVFTKLCWIREGLYLDRKALEWSYGSYKVAISKYMYAIYFSAGTLTMIRQVNNG